MYEFFEYMWKDEDFILMAIIFVPIIVYSIVGFLFALFFYGLEFDSFSWNSIFLKKFFFKSNSTMDPELDLEVELASIFMSNKNIILKSPVNSISNNSNIPTAEISDALSNHEIENYSG